MVVTAAPSLPPLLPLLAGFIICACFTFNAPESVGLNIYCIAIAVVIGLVEMPLICSCFRE